MRDALAMWRNTRLVVLTAMTASLYAALLIPFKVLPLIPGVTELRPGNAIPVVCSFLFGPAAAWGAAIGNLIGDFFGGIGPGDLFGFAGNFLYGFLPYHAWRALTDADPLPRSPGGWIAFVAVVALAAGLCALTIGWGLNLFGFVPFALLGNLIFINNFLMAVVLAPLLLAAVYPRVKQAGLRYDDLVAAPPRPSRRRRLGLALVVVGALAGFLIGNAISTGRLEIAALATDPAGTRAAQVGVGVAPFLVLVLIGLLLL
ncbi:MAG: QueT transporter family protein [Deltaproteobacteria bacterium]|nr:QueT transporter family protein [Deltaproteobacteria bacterium]